MTLSEWRAYVQNAYEEGRMLPSRQWSILIDLVLKLGERVQWDAPPLKSFVDSLCEEMKHAFDKTDE